MVKANTSTQILPLCQLTLLPSSNFKQKNEQFEITKLRYLNYTSFGLAHEIVAFICNICFTHQKKAKKNKKKKKTSYEDYFQEGYAHTATNMVSQDIQRLLI